MHGHFERTFKRWDFKRHEGVLSSLPKSLSREIKFSLVQGSLQKVPIVARGSLAFQADLSGLVSYIHWDAGSYIIAHGDAATGLYFIVSGMVAVLDDEGWMVKEMGEGSTVGDDVAFVEGSIATYSVRVPRSLRGGTGTLFLDMESCELLSKRHPDFKEAMVAVGKIRRASRTLDDDKRRTRPQTPPFGANHWAEVVKPSKFKSFVNDIQRKSDEISKESPRRRKSRRGKQ